MTGPDHLGSMHCVKRATCIHLQQPDVIRRTVSGGPGAGRQRRTVWDKLAGDWKSAALATGHTEISLAALDDSLTAILQGRITGRTLVYLDA
jgi:hypothetical protein